MLSGFYHPFIYCCIKRPHQKHPEQINDTDFAHINVCVNVVLIFIFFIYFPFREGFGFKKSFTTFTHEVVT